jgi:hypothetical protein
MGEVFYYIIMSLDQFISKIKILVDELVSGSDSIISVDSLKIPVLEYLEIAINDSIVPLLLEVPKNLLPVMSPYWSKVTSVTEGIMTFNDLTDVSVVSCRYINKEGEVSVKLPFNDFNDLVFLVGTEGYFCMLELSNGMIIRDLYTGIDIVTGNKVAEISGFTASIPLANKDNVGLITTPRDIVRIKEVKLSSWSNSVEEITSTLDPRYNLTKNTYTRPTYAKPMVVQHSPNTVNCYSAKTTYDTVETFDYVPALTVEEIPTCLTDLLCWKSAVTYLSITNNPLADKAQALYASKLQSHYGKI